jgi:hypothetical protein
VAEKLGTCALCSNKAVDTVSIAQKVTTCPTCGRENADYLHVPVCADHLAEYTDPDQPLDAPGLLLDVALRREGALGLPLTQPRREED